MPRRVTKREKRGGETIGGVAVTATSVQEFMNGIVDLELARDWEGPTAVSNEDQPEEEV